MNQLTENQDLVIQVMREARTSLRSPLKSAEDYPGKLAQQRLVRAVTSVKKSETVEGIE